MREPLEMVTVSFMQHVVQFRKKNTCFVTKLLFEMLEKVLVGFSALRAPTVGPYLFQVAHLGLKFGSKELLQYETLI